MTNEISRFENLFIPEPNSGCWLWIGAVYGTGYGAFSIKFHGRWKMDAAHRMSWRLYCGDIPNGAFVLHKCDVRPCVNPDHLFIGSHTDNMRDMSAKGRDAFSTGRHISQTTPYKIRRGGRHHWSKLNEEQVAEIKKLLIAGTNRRELSLRFGVHANTIWRIGAGINWVQR